ncbi:P-type conjugative transfer protein TrbJ [Sphingomonas sp. MAHUQ-71]|uniref:P-type conjugative transfer protein TrbJ n=2 Tax=Sphingomonas oryzagri TaxID=3042314 RepID=A0ABT6MYM1_9SPHN|nr:P-type conjugative transfer protein TrbJ [Sphingomonas oryzagri]
MLASVSTTTLVPAPADAIIVFDPSNYSQNVLTAARTLQQINNQIQSLQNQATSLLNQARNLETIGFSELGPLTATLQQIQTLMGQASGIQFRVDTMKNQFQQLFPSSFSQLMTNAQRANQANTRYRTAMSAYQHTMTVQAQIVENVQSDATSLNTIIAKSQGASGALQAAQATNQLLALTAKQQFQIEQMVAAQYRAQAIDQARRDQAESDGQAATTKFLGSGSAYTPQ